MTRQSSHLLALLALVLLLKSTLALAENYPQVMIILDGSGSMWGPAGEERKIEAARKVVKQIVPQLPPEVQIGLTSYGHRRKGDCDDVETLVPIGAANREQIISQVDTINPVGMTPIADSIKLIADQLKSSEVETTIVLVSDGEETCNADPCAVVKKLRETGIKFVMQVVGFGVNKVEKEQLECIAKEGGGSYFSAADANSLLQAFESATQEVKNRVEELKIEPAASEKKKVTSGLGKLTIKMPSRTTESVAAIKIIRISDEKVIKEAKEPEAISTHPLPAGQYKVVLGLANSNYQKDSEAEIGIVTVQGGQEVELLLGAITLNISEEIKKDLPVTAVTLFHSNSAEIFVENKASGNDYYLFKSKPVPAGSFQLGFTFGQNKSPTIVKEQIDVAEGQEVEVLFDSGIRLIKVEEQPVTAWNLTPAGKEQPYLKVERRWDNDYPLWKTFPVAPGRYNLQLFLKGMDEPLEVGEDIEISPGQLVEFDTGL